MFVTNIFEYSGKSGHFATSRSPVALFVCQISPFESGDHREGERRTLLGVKKVFFFRKKSQTVGGWGPRVLNFLVENTNNFYMLY